MKKILIFCICAFVLLSIAGCSASSGPAVTPQEDTIQKIYFQKTNIDEQKNYTYTEKEITDAKMIRNFCKAINSLTLQEEDPLKYSDVEYLVVFECGKRHKLMILKEDIIYDGATYKSVKGNLRETFSALFDGLAVEEKKTTSKLFS